MADTKEENGTRTHTHAALNVRVLNHFGGPPTKQREQRQLNGRIICNNNNNTTDKKKRTETMPPSSSIFFFFVFSTVRVLLFPSLLFSSRVSCSNSFLLLSFLRPPPPMNYIKAYAFNSSVHRMWFDFSAENSCTILYTTQRLWLLSCLLPVVVEVSGIFFLFFRFLVSVGRSVLELKNVIFFYLPATLSSTLNHKTLQSVPVNFISFSF